MQPATYELTIAGGVGPVLRASLAPGLAAVPHECTIIRAVSDTDVDLVDLVLWLHTHGLDIEAVLRVHPGTQARPGNPFTLDG